jgi:hypothetical protein
MSIYPIVLYDNNGLLTLIILISIFAAIYPVMSVSQKRIIENALMIKSDLYSSSLILVSIFPAVDQSINLFIIF